MRKWQLGDNHKNTKNTQMAARKIVTGGSCFIDEVESAPASIAENVYKGGMPK